MMTKSHIFITLTTAFLALGGARPERPCVCETPAHDEVPPPETSESVAGMVMPYLTEHCVAPPKECPHPDITFHLYTRDSQQDPHQLSVGDQASVSSARFERGQPVKVIIHGYTGHKDFAPNPEIRPAYLKKHPYNVISVDYGPLARDGCYIQATYNVDLVGNCTAQMIDYLVDQGAARLEDFHVIGFSLGGQVAGQVGRFLKSGQLQRVTGLDPAMPNFFFFSNADSKLDASDARFVDVVHTNAAFKGKTEMSGTVDFYINGGFNQPGCESVNVAGYSTCSHNRAPQYFAESIDSEAGFWGRPCSGWFYCMIGWTNMGAAVLMGENVPLSTRGQYYVPTTTGPHFAKGKWW
ncbi:pancreatic triacylglycerol lipase-like [Bacillus rossius redtenbacheri]|uniref:pancreatic triacylglycerol lipase-like n=1 Tax=Bacillus rossius redtenbacheri TaxID=93214 RepID=UPI002FDDD47F